MQVRLLCLAEHLFEAHLVRVRIRVRVSMKVRVRVSIRVRVRVGISSNRTRCGMECHVVGAHGRSIISLSKLEEG